MTKETRIFEIPTSETKLWRFIRHSDFGIPLAFVIRASSFILNLLTFSTSAGTHFEQGGEKSGLKSFEPFQIRQDQFRQLPTVTTFQNAENRHAQFANGLSQPVKILLLQCFLREGVACIGVGPG